MYSFNELRKAAKQVVEGKEVRVAILGNCATQFFAKSLLGYAKLSGINANVFDADYNQIEAQLLDVDSELYHFSPDTIVLWLATEKLYEEFLDMPLSNRAHFADIYIEKIRGYWELIEKNSKAKVIQMNFTEIDDKVLGEYSAKVDISFIYQMRKLNFLLEEAMRSDANVYPVDLLAIQIRIGAKNFFDAPMYYSAKLSASMNALPYITKAVVDVQKSILGKIKKCIILDLDNTLWGGVIGDDGIGGIEIGELGKGHVFTNFQRWLKQLKEAGIILAVCSKNTESVAKEPFEKNEEMVLHLDDISVFVANWEDKATNIKLIQETLNIGMDSIVFVDDNPFERNLVRQMIKDIEVPELPEDPALYLGYLQECNYFDCASYVGVKSDRTKLYQAEFQRKQLQVQYQSIDDYLKSLEMIGKAEKFMPENYARIAQLTQRSNQFNLRTMRYSEADIQAIAENENFLTMSLHLKDKFGDHGLVSVVILEKKNEQEVFVDTWLMSCRVLKRGMEEYVVNEIVKLARAHGFKKITAEYIPTPKNAMVEKIYEKMGFTNVGENNYALGVDSYKDQVSYINEEE